MTLSQAWGIALFLIWLGAAAYGAVRAARMVRRIRLRRQARREQKINGLVEHLANSALLRARLVGLVEGLFLLVVASTVLPIDRDMQRLLTTLALISGAVILALSLTMDDINDERAEQMARGE